MVSGKRLALFDEPLATLKEMAVGFRRRPLTTQLFVVGIAALYLPTLWEVARGWLTDDNYAHGVFIFPVALFLLWLQRDALQKAAYRPAPLGLVPLACGLLMEVVGHFFHIYFVVMLSLLPVLAGMTLILHGPALWRVARFPILFLIFAAPLPHWIFAPASNWIQSASTTGASIVMKALGYPLLQTGNVIEIPGMALEVAEVCSGFKKLVALLAFSTLYGTMFAISPGKRLALFLAAIPVALLANIIRVAGLIAVSSAGGPQALHIAHDWAEITVLVIAFGLFVLLGKGLGCKTLRFSL